MKKEIVLIKNQTIGGGDRYFNKVNDELKKKYRTTIYSPAKYDRKSNFICNPYEYIKYVYFYLPSYYLKLGRDLNKKKVFRVIVFQDSYRKSPDVLRTYKGRRIYILHEPPREFYEPLNLHAPKFMDKIFTILFRTPIFFFDRLNTHCSQKIISNSNFSRQKIKEIYNMDSKVVYPGFNKLCNNKYKRKKQCVSVGSLMPYKGHDLAIKSLSRIPTMNRPNLVIVGSGSEHLKNAILKLSKSKKVKVKIISEIDDQSLGKIYSESKVYINTAFQEPFGMSSLEAIGHGCKLVTVNKCGTTELKKFFPNSVTVTESDEKKIGNAVEKALLTKTNRLGSMREFEWKTVTSKILKG